MKRSALFERGTLALALTVLALVFGSFASHAAATGKKPNILVIMGDDIGWYNTSIYNRGDMGYRTPNIDRIGQEGALFTCWYGQQSCTAGRAAYVWGWPLVNNLNRSLGVFKLREPGRLGGIVPASPIGQICMLTDYIDPAEKFVTCPNQDTVYGAGYQRLDSVPVIVQVPDFGDWVPAPADDFSLYIRAYWPGAEILEGKWTPPPVKRS